MAESPSISGWKKLAIRAFVGGAGFACALAIIAGAALWYHNRPEGPKPWNATALQAKYRGLELTTGSTKDPTAYSVSFYYDVKNNTDRNYAINTSALTPMAVLTDGNALSKEFGHYQSGEAAVDGPAFIPPGGTARVLVRVSYFYPDEFTQADKDDAKKVFPSVDRRLKELSGFVVFDEQNHYRIDLPEGWKNWEGVKESKSAAPTGPH
jgi:hypothetical protein